MDRVTLENLEHYVAERGTGGTIEEAEQVLGVTLDPGRLRAAGFIVGDGDYEEYGTYLGASR